MKKRSVKILSSKDVLLIGGVMAAIVLCIGIVLGVILFNSKVTPVSNIDDEVAEIKIELVGGDEVIEVFSEYSDKGVNAYYCEADSAPKSVDVQTSGTVDTSKVGKYVITYESTHNGQSAQAQRVVEVVDLIPPVISSPDEIVGVPGEELTFEYSAIDNSDGELGADKFKIEKRGDSVVLTVSDSSGNTSSKEVKLVGVDDDEAPVLTLNGDESMSVRSGSAFNDPGASAVDTVFGDLTAQIAVEGSVDTSVIGTYILTYTVTDPAGNSASVSRTVVVYPHMTSSTAPQNNGKTVYLTFDDGPCELTADILDILAEYEVKATFFVTAQSKDYFSQIARAHDEGHVIGVHTLTHDFAIYSSTATYFEDLLAMEEIVKEQTGDYTDIIRFPGGSSNTISRNYCVGIMSQLAEEVQEQGYSYFDWNVDSGDTSTSDPNVIYENVINGISGRQSSIILMHDIKIATRDALPDIIEYCLNNGYSFGVLSSEGPFAHHAITN